MFFSHIFFHVLLTHMLLRIRVFFLLEKAKMWFDDKGFCLFLEEEQGAASRAVQGLPLEQLGPGAESWLSYCQSYYLSAAWLGTQNTGEGWRAGNELPIDFKHSFNLVIISSIDIIILIIIPTYHAPVMTPSLCLAFWLSDCGDLN